LPSVVFPTIIDFQVSHDGSMALHVHNDDNLGMAVVTGGRQFFESGETAEVRCEPKGNNVFVGWSLGAAANQNSTVPEGQIVSFLNTYSFAIKADTELYANYHLPQATLFQYHANGGRLKNSNIDSFYADSRTTYPGIQRPNTVQGSQYLERRGYTLTSWNTKADGTGSKIGLGSKADYDMLHNGMIDLYATWEEWTPDNSFVFETIEGGVAVSSFVGSTALEKIVVPSLHDDLPVLSIRTKAFTNCSFKSLVLPDALKQVEDGACFGCEMQETLTLFTSTAEIYPTSFSSLVLKTVNINANTFNTDAISRNDITFGHDLALAANKNKPTFYIVGLSTILWNNPASIIDEAYGGRYNIIKIGGQSGASTALTFDILNLIFRPGDKAVVSLHTDFRNPNTTSQYTLAYLDNNLDLFSRCNYQDYKDTFFGKAWKDWQRTQTSDTSVLAYGYDAKSPYNTYGGKDWPSQEVVDPSNREANDISISDVFVTQQPFRWIDSALDSRIDRANIALSPSTYNENAVTPETRTKLIAAHQNTLSYMPEYAHFETQEDNILPGIQFRYQDNTHLSIAGGTLKMRRWVSQLQNFLS
jgi:hypothetical protein